MKVAVIGAGLGGLLAAAALSKEHDVRVFEQLDMYGGRFLICRTKVSSFPPALST